MTILYMLWHSYQPDPEVDHDEEKFIGLYSTEEKAKTAVERLRHQPGFRDYPDSPAARRCHRLGRRLCFGLGRRGAGRRGPGARVILMRNAGH